MISEELKTKIEFRRCDCCSECDYLKMKDSYGNGYSTSYSYSCSLHKFKFEFKWL